MGGNAIRLYGRLQQISSGLFDIHHNSGFALFIKIFTQMRYYGAKKIVKP
uniref:Uncharacterized protein n=1 Tax=Rhizophagus irregularis (strain DAOM 181602 / DAOM 197198 / MUCL 43194) TaxID=747089 RepID=U9U179_RHIID